MLLSEMITAFNEKGIDIMRYKYKFGLVPNCIPPSEFFSYDLEKKVYQQISHGDRDNGVVVMEYDTEDKMVSDMLSFIERECEWDKCTGHYKEYPLQEILAVTRELRRIAGS